MSNGRVLYFDVLKLMSCFLVIMLHDVAYLLNPFAPGLKWMAVDLLSASTRAAVPVFLMVSGALMLPRPMDDLRRYYAYCLRYMGPLLVALLVYRINQRLFHEYSGSFFSGVLFDFDQTQAFHLWYMWMLFGLLLVAPLLQCIIQNTKMMYLFLGLWAFFRIAVPTGDHLGQHFPIWNGMFISGSGYFVLGHALHRNAFGWTGRWSCRQLAQAAGVLVLLMATLVYVDSYTRAQYTEFFFSMESPTVAMLSVVLFLWCQQRFSGQNASPLVAELSNATFAVFLYHMLVLSHFIMRIESHTLLTVLVTAPLTFCITMLLCVICRRTPYIRRLISA